MNVVSFLVRSERHTKSGERTVRLVRYGWSEADEPSARDCAERRLDAAERLLEAGQRPVLVEILPRYRSAGLSWAGPEPVPIVELPVRREGRELLTRNSYGAVSLNTPDVLFCDIDVSERVPPRTGVGASLFLTLGLVVAAGWGLVFAWLAADQRLLVGLSWTLVAIAVGFVIQRGRPRSSEPRLDTQALRPAEAWVEAHPGWHLRVYETAAGYRLLAMHAAFDPTSDEVQDFFAAVSADPNFARMCKLQACFRARLTPKPWRMGVRPEGLRRPRLGSRTPEFSAAWVREYELTSKRYAVCKYVMSLGSTARVSPRAEEVRRLHDQAVLEQAFGERAPALA